LRTFRLKDEEIAKLTHQLEEKDEIIASYRNSTATGSTSASFFPVASQHINLINHNLQEENEKLKKEVKKIMKELTEKKNELEQKSKHFDVYLPIYLLLIDLMVSFPSFIGCSRRITKV
jgi:1-aminocyclopropane-1-carboxylate deaminase/D-cysteine desulfhydrase-like pyridoxal-dependent ACC family enzyme